MTTRKKLSLALVAVVGSLAVGSIAFAAIPDGAGTIHGCYDKQSGQLRVTDTATSTPKTCSSKESALVWSQQGPQGQPGPQGDPGPSDAYEVGPTIVHLPAAQSTQVRTLSLPPGSYVVSAKLYAAADGLNIGPAIVHCQLSVDAGGGTVYDHARGTVYSNGSGDVFDESLALMRSYSSAQPLTAQVWCTSEAPALVGSVELNAIKVGTLH